MVSDETYEAVLDEIAIDGNVDKALRRHKVSTRTYYARLARDEKFRERHNAAKTQGYHLVADQLRKLQDQKPPMVKTQFGEQVDRGWVQWQRNRVDLLKWLLAHIQPEKYGDRTILSGDANNPVAVEISDPKAALLRGLAPKPADDGAGSEGGGADR